MTIQRLDEIPVLYHGTTKKEWTQDRERKGVLYLTKSIQDASFYAEEASMAEWSEDNDPVQIIVAIGQKALEKIAGMPGVEICPDWGWVEAQDHEKNIRGEEVTDLTWQDSFNGCGCICIMGFEDKYKELFSVLSMGEEPIKKKEKSVKTYTKNELEAMDTDLLDRIAFGYAEGDIDWLETDQINIVYECDMENPQYRYEKEGIAWVNSVDLSEPVSISIDTEGRYNLEDGHHRYFAAQKRGEKLIAMMEIKGNPVKAILTRQALARSEKKNSGDEGLSPSH